MGFCKLPILPSLALRDTQFSYTFSKCPKNPRLYGQEHGHQANKKCPVCGNKVNHFTEQKGKDRCLLQGYAAALALHEADIDSCACMEEVCVYLKDFSFLDLSLFHCTITLFSHNPSRTPEFQIENLSNGACWIWMRIKQI